MKKYILMLWIIVHSCLLHASEKTNYRTDARKEFPTPNLIKTGKHFQILYKIYEELEQVYALNLFYSGTPYQCKPEQRSRQIILKNLSQWNDFIRSRLLTDKNHFNEEAIEMITTLQIHKKDAQYLTLLCKKYNKWRHDNYTERANFAEIALKAHDSIIYSEKLRRAGIKDDFDEELKKIKEEKISVRTKADQSIPSHHFKILEDFPELQFFEIEQEESTKRDVIEENEKNNLFEIISSSYNQRKSMKDARRNSDNQWKIREYGRVK